MGFRIWFTVSTVVRKGLNLCILDMFDHTCSGLKKSKFLWVFCMLFTLPTVVEKSLNFDVQMFQEFVHYYCVVFSHVVYHIYSGWKRSKFVYF